MELSNNTVSKVIIECLTNRTLFEIVKNNLEGFMKFANFHKDSPVFDGVVNYIGNIDYDSFNSLNLNSKLRDKGISEGVLSDLLNNIDYLREINSNKSISPESVSLLKSIFYSGHYESVRGKEYSEIFDYCKTIEWVTDYIDPRFKIEDISSDIDIDEVVALLSPTNSIKSSFNFVNESSPNKGYLPNEMITVSAAPGTGKTQFCFTEALNFIKQGKRVMYIALGDMVNYTIIIRLMCMYLRISPEEAYMDLKRYLDEFTQIEEIKNNFKFVVLKSGEVLSKDLFNFLNTVNSEYDVWMVDYDGNFASNTDNMYKQGSETYDDGINLCRTYNKLGFIISQPKIAFWTSEALGMECLAESSRKQQITDAIITFGRRQGVNNRCGLAQIVKGRNRELRFRIPWAAAESGQTIEIDNDMYGELIESPDLIRLKVNTVGTLDMPDKYLD